ncbi:hypothetical protein SUVZ_15G3720 [Saccharomyces uvarum]|uniref:mannitol 2-dehydrogenase n=1 Tax=Saccharomyces uvarum TaxID=230603 RepID=A0ABN8WL75_SACUV|nr:hypothetical protein SUVZ_15G3720 [Saccharomyces uvarum]
MTKPGETAATSLNAKTLKSFQSTLPVPTYPREGVKQGIVHLGVGAFHRSHLAVFMQRLMQEHNVKDWSICGVGLMKADAPMRDAMDAQNCLYTLVERGIKDTNAYIVGSITAYMYAPDDPKAVIAKMAHPDTRIVSLTVTENGYYHNEATHSLMADDAAIVNDLNHPERPNTIYGYLYEALLLRYKESGHPFTIMSCDNMPQNGITLKAMLVEFAKLKDPKFAAWIAEKVTAPNSMVDRVTPRCTDVERKFVADTYGIQDKCPVVAEPFIQWVLEDNFSDGRPPWELAGVQVVKDVESYELMKLRLLNGGHSAMGYLGYLAGYTYIHEVVNDPTINKYIRVLMHEEVIPLLPKVPGVDFEEYTASVLERFSNPAIQDTVSRICLMGSGKMPKYVLPSIYEQLRRPDSKYKLLAVCVAGWFRYLTGKDMNGKPFEIEDPMAPILQKAAVKGGSDPHELLSIDCLFGPELRDNKEFVAQLTHSLKAVYNNGPLAAVKEVLDQV